VNGGTVVLVWGEWSPSRLCRFTPGEGRVSGANWTGGRMVWTLCCTSSRYPVTVPTELSISACTWHRHVIGTVCTNRNVNITCVLSSDRLMWQGCIADWTHRKATETVWTFLRRDKYIDPPGLQTAVLSFMP